MTPGHRHVRARQSGVRVAWRRGNECGGPAPAYNLDPSQTPRSIDIGTAKGIYELDGDTPRLKYFVAQDQGGKRNVRPTDVRWEKGDGFGVMECKRKPH